MRKVTLYTRVGCHLCDAVKLVLDEVCRETPFELELLDIDRDEALLALYNVEVPVVTIDGKKAFKYRMTAAQLRSRLARA